MAGLLRTNTIIVGAAGRDFHNFNVLYRNNPGSNVVAFTATQIPNIAGRRYPAELAGSLYPSGIPIYEESELESLIKAHNVREVVFSYSDVSAAHVLSLGSRVSAAGARFVFLSAHETMLTSSKPVISVCAVRTGCGKSQTSRAISGFLRTMGYKVAAIRHPMPYGDLVKQRVQRFDSIDDLTSERCTIEEMEEYEPHIKNGTIVYAGVDYQAILDRAEQESDVIIWDGGNNDTSFYKPDLAIVVADPLRVGHETSYYPSETNLRLADVVIINKIDSAEGDAVQRLRENIRRVNPRARVLLAKSPVSVDNPGAIKGKNVLVIEDGPTLTHGEMKIGAGSVAANKFGASSIIDPRPWCSGEIKKTFERYPGIGTLLPAMGYGDAQIKDLEETINRVPCDAVIIGTPIDLGRFIHIDHPSVRVTYDLVEVGEPMLEGLIRAMLEKRDRATIVEPETIR
ncbi:MAG: cyclic 2,3-diphosphoglycerate synthase [Bacteroidota bacterium]